MKFKKIIIVTSIILFLLIGGFFLIRSIIKTVVYDPIENNSLGKSTITYRKALVLANYEKLNEVFKKYYPLTLKDSLYLEDISEGSFQNSLRSLDAEEKTTVTAINAARGIYTYPYNEPFLKMHAEQSTLQNFEKDKLTIVNFLDSLATEENNEIIKQSYKDIEYYSLDDKAIKTSSVIGQVQMFFPKEQMIVTVYLFNQNEGKESYKTLEEYKALKTKFIQSIIDSAITTL